MFFQTEITSNSLFKREFAKILAYSGIIGVLEKINERKIEIDNQKHKYKIYLLKEGSTPFWKFNEKKKHHVIAIPYADAEDKNALAETFHSFLHESMHAICSPADFKKIEEISKKENVPFEFFNIVEDLYIETFFKKYFMNNKIPLFAFAKKEYGINPLEKIDKFLISKEDEPLNILIKMLYTSGEYADSAFENPYFLNIKNHLEKIYATADPYERLELIAHMYKDLFPNKNKEEFKNELNQARQNISQDTDNNKIFDEDLLSLLENLNQNTQKNSVNEKNNEKQSNLGIGEDLNEAILNDIETLLTNGNAEEVNESEIMKNLNISPKKVKIDFKSEQKGLTEGQEFGDAVFIDINSPKSKDNFIVSPQTLSTIEYIKQEIENLTKKLYKTKKVNKFSGKKLNPLGLKDFYYSKNINAKLFKEKQPIENVFPSFLFYIDISGSMDGVPLESIKVLLTALNEIAYYNKNAQFSFILMGDGKYQGIHMPINAGKIWEIKTNGGTSNHDLIIEKTKAIREKYDFCVYISDLFIPKREEAKIKEINDKEKKLLLFYVDDMVEKTLKKAQNIINDPKKIFISSDIKEAVSEFFKYLKSKTLKLPPQKRIKKIKKRTFKM